MAQTKIKQTISFDFDVLAALKEYAPIHRTSVSGLANKILAKELLGDHVRAAVEGAEITEEVPKVEYVVEGAVVEPPVAVASIDRKCCKCEGWEPETGNRSTDLHGDCMPRAMMTGWQTVCEKFSEWKVV